MEQGEQEAIRPEESALIQDVMDLLFEGGIRKIAKVWPEFSTPQEVLVPNRALEYRRRGIQYQGFVSREAAEAWLDAV